MRKTAECKDLNIASVDLEDSVYKGKDANQEGQLVVPEEQLTHYKALFPDIKVISIEQFFNNLGSSSQNP